MSDRIGDELGRLPETEALVGSNLELAGLTATPASSSQGFYVRGKLLSKATLSEGRASCA